MPATVLTLTETTDTTGYVLGVFTDLGLAIAAARSWADHRIARCMASDARLLGTAPSASTYRMVLNADAGRADLSILHVPSGECDDVRWQIRSFDVVEPVPKPETVEANFSPCGRAA